MQLQNNSVNGAMLITINRVITHVITTNILQNERQDISVVISVAFNGDRDIKMDHSMFRTILKKNCTMLAFFTSNAVRNIIFSVFISRSNL